jgi:hypothetical protein
MFEAGSHARRGLFKGLGLNCPGNLLFCGGCHGVHEPGLGHDLWFGGGKLGLCCGSGG